MGEVVRPIRAKDKDKYRVVEETQRPFRLWNASERRDVAHRCYATERRALDSALLLVRWSKIGVSLEVYDIRTATWIGTYTRRVDSIIFTK